MRIESLLVIEVFSAISTLVDSDFFESRASSAPASCRAAAWVASAMTKQAERQLVRSVLRGGIVEFLWGCGERELSARTVDLALFVWSRGPNSRPVGETMSQRYNKLVALLEELFQLDQPDLDFGFYRVMHAKSAVVSP